MNLEKVLAGKTAVVTGGGTGIGRAIAKALANAGANIVVCGRRLTPCEQTCSQLPNEIQKLAVSSDVSNVTDVGRLMEIALKRFGRIDVLVNNAAIAGASKPFLEVSLESWQRTLSVNLTSVMLCSQVVARHMVEVGGGKIINIGSVLAFKVAPNSADYCASKGGMLQLTRAMALELARHNIQVNAICPGYFRTDFAPDLPENAEEAGAWAKKKRIPARRLGDPSEIGPLAIALAAGNYVIGSSFVIDGGVLLA